MDAGAEARIDVADVQLEDGTAPKPDKPPAGRSPFASLLGDVTWLMVRSPAHRHLFLADPEWLVLRRSPPAEARLLSGQPRLRPGDWKSGDRAWLIDLVAPFGGAEGLARSIKAQAFADRTLKALRPRGDGKGFEGVEVTSAAAAAEQCGSQ